MISTYYVTKEMVYPCMLEAAKRNFVDVLSVLLKAGADFSVGGCGMFAGVFPQWKDGAIVGSRSRAIVWRGVRGRNSPFLHLMHRRQDGLGVRKRAHCYSRQPAASEAGPAG